MLFALHPTLARDSAAEPYAEGELEELRGRLAAAFQGGLGTFIAK